MEVLQSRLELGKWFDEDGKRWGNILGLEEQKAHKIVKKATETMEGD